MPFRHHRGNDNILRNEPHGPSSAPGALPTKIIGFYTKVIFQKKTGKPCAKCKQPTAAFSGGKRKGKHSIYCLNHLLQQRERNRLAANFKRWVETGGDPAAWNAAREWLVKRFTAVSIV
jgi:hypothetical protein